MCKTLLSSVTDTDPVLFSPLDPGSGSGMNFFRISDPDTEGKIFGEIFLNYLKNPCYFIILLIRLAPETTRSMKKVRFILHPSFYVQKDPG
jgi:hypothetical protein